MCPGLPSMFTRHQNKRTKKKKATSLSYCFNEESSSSGIDSKINGDQPVNLSEEAPKKIPSGKGSNFHSFKKNAMRLPKLSLKANTKRIIDKHSSMPASPRSCMKN